MFIWGSRLNCESMSFRRLIEPAKAHSTGF
jgi:hypothetical protein